MRCAARRINRSPQCRFTKPRCAISNSCIHEVLGAVDTLNALPRYADLDVDTINQVVEEAGKFCEELLLPINQSGDAEGCTYDAATHSVKTPHGFKRCVSRPFALRVGLDWQARPSSVAKACRTCCRSRFTKCSIPPIRRGLCIAGLTIGATECLLLHGTDEQKNLYLAKLTSGQWTGTMCLTEPHCGTDLGLMRTKAEPQADGSYQLTGGKRFLSPSGEHDLAENIIHLVLARLPDAPQGTKGISLFMVPKFLPEGAGAEAKVGARNGLYCGGIEHKMGIQRQRDVPDESWIVRPVG